MHGTANALLRNWSGLDRLKIVGGEGVELIDDTGRRYLDAASGVGVTCLGYGDAHIPAAMLEQMNAVQYVHAARFEAPVVRILAERVATLAPSDLDAVFFTSGGSEANESAFKFARQYWLEQGHPEKWRIVGRRPSYHGNSLATLSAGWHAGRRQRYAPLLPDFLHVDAPNPYRGCARCHGSCTADCARALEETIMATGPESIAAFIAEPVIGAAAGALVPPEGYFREIRAICDRHQVLLIADEVLTGFGRTGRPFGIERFGVVPDLITFAKGISAGYAPLGGMIARRSLVGAIEEGSGRFEHTFTHAGHPVACAAGVATLERLEGDRLFERVATLEEFFLGTLRRELGGNSLVGDIRGLGLLAGIELVRDRESKRPFPAHDAIASRAGRLAIEEGVIIYPGSGGLGLSGADGDYVLLMPPFTSSEDQLVHMVSRLGRALDRLANEL